MGLSPASSLIHFMIPDMYTAEVSASNQVRFWPTSSTGLRAIGLPTKRPLLFSSLSWRSWRQSWRPHKGEVLAASNWTYVYTATKECSRVIRLTPWRVGDLQEGWIPESYVPQQVEVHLPTYIRLSEEATYHKPVAPPIQWKGWLHRLI